MRRVAVFLSDTHGGHRLGLMNPKIRLFDEDESGNPAPYTPQSTAVQEYLWDLYQLCVGEVAAFADGDPVYLFHVGDLTQGKTYPDHLVTTRMADQILIATENLSIWFEVGMELEAVRLATGTGSHIFGESSSTVLVAQHLRERFHGVDILAVSQGLAIVDGVRIDYAHHGPSAGIREWTEGNQLRYYSKSLAIGDALRRKEPPRLIVRGHFHEWSWETVRIAKRYEVDIILLPSLCGMGEHGRKATGSKNYITNGVIVVEILDGEMRNVIDLVQEMDLRFEEDLTDG